MHASAHLGPATRRRRRKSAWGNRLKRTYVEIILIEKGKAAMKPAKKRKQTEAKHKEKTKIVQETIAAESV